ncbi:MAG TPA: hypothetical protein VMD77_05575 [Candidatus Baltobacteraceae bacterium]|nr:hypothetical protein [Candidatus Baltobacteraceae bacterium]
MEIEKLPLLSAAQIRKAMADNQDDHLSYCHELASFKPNVSPDDLIPKLATQLLDAYQYHTKIIYLTIDELPTYTKRPILSVADEREARRELEINSFIGYHFALDALRIAIANRLMAEEEKR